MRGSPILTAAGKEVQGGAETEMNGRLVFYSGSSSEWDVYFRKEQAMKYKSKRRVPTSHVLQQNHTAQTLYPDQTLHAKITVLEKTPRNGVV